VSCRADGVKAILVDFSGVVQMYYVGGLAALVAVVVAALINLQLLEMICLTLTCLLSFIFWYVEFGAWVCLS
jgi:hypothetical protein